MWCRSTLEVDMRADGKTVVITGCNTGIGRAAAEEFHIRGAHIVICSRSMLMGEVAKRDIRMETPGGCIDVVHLNLGSIDSIRHSAGIILEKCPRIDILINNAATIGNVRKETVDGMEEHIGVNHMGHFLFTHLLLDNIKAAAPSRIITLTDYVPKNTHLDFEDIMNYNNYTPYLAYYRSKLANIMFTRQLAKRLQGTGVTTYALNPGHVDSRLTRGLPGWQGYIVQPIVPLFAKPAQACLHVVNCALSPELADMSGEYIEKRQVKQPKALEALDDDICEKLWSISNAYVGIRG